MERNCDGYPYSTAQAVTSAMIHQTQECGKKSVPIPRKWKTDPGNSHGRSSLSSVGSLLLVGAVFLLFVGVQPSRPHRRRCQSGFGKPYGIAGLGITTCRPPSGSKLVKVCFSVGTTLELILEEELHWAEATRLGS